jgi:hypothetical protein
MKRIMLYILSALALSACNPVVDNKDIGSVLSEDQLDIVVKSTSEGSNEVILENNTPGVAPYWDYIIGKSTNQKEVIRLPFMGEMEIQFTAICDGGTVTTTRKVNIAKIDKPAEPEWTMFAGSGTEGKVWVWNVGEDNDVVYGTAGYGSGDPGPSWSTATAGSTIGGKLVPADEEMLFDLNGGANMTKRKIDGTVVEKGTFKFDMTKRKLLDDGTPWSIGQLDFSGVTIICGSECWSTTSVYTFDIISLSADEMMLAYSAPATPFGEWMEATFWRFKAK